MLKGFLRNRRVQVGLGVFVFFILVAAFGGLIVDAYGHGALAVDYDHLHSPPAAGGHLLGTNIAGQDVFSQLVIGARGSMSVGLMSGVLATVIAGLVGVTSGFLGGKLDQVLNMVTNVFLTLPSFALTLIAAGYLSARGGAGSTAMGWVAMAVLIGAFEWPGGARYLRSQTLSLRGRDFAMATKMLGESSARLIFVEVMPHLLGIMSAMFLRAVVAGIFAEAALNFLGVSTSGTVSWGTMIAEAQNQGALLQGYWWWFVPPGLCIAIVGTATALVNFGLDEVTNPRLRTANRKVVRAFERAQRRLRDRGRTGAAPGGEAA